MHKSAIFGLFLMASLLLGTSVNMNMFSSASAQGMEQYDNSYEQQSTYGNDPYGSSSYDTSYSDDKSYDSSYDKESSYGPQQPSYGYDNNHHMVHNNHHMTNQNILLKALTATTVTTKLRIKNMNVEQVHSKAFS